jgi:hypothetical protein
VIDTIVVGASSSRARGDRLVTRVGFRGSIENDQAARGEDRECSQFGAEGSEGLPWDGGQDRDDEDGSEQAVASGRRDCGAPGRER